MLNRAPSYPIRPLAHFLPHVPSPSPLQQWLHFALHTDVAVVSKSEYATSTYYKKCPNMRLSIGLTTRDSLWERYTLLLRRRESGALKACETHKKTFLLRFAICSHHRRNLHLKKHFYFPLNNRKFLHISKKAHIFLLKFTYFSFNYWRFGLPYIEWNVHIACCLEISSEINLQNFENFSYSSIFSHN